MGYIKPEMLAGLKQIDLLTYLQECEPYELVRLSDRVYTTKTHDSLKISNGKWCWWSQSIGGRSALDYLIKVKNMSLTDAAETLLEMRFIPDTSPPTVSKPASPFQLPARYANNDRAIAYLRGRGIDLEIIEYFIGAGQIYETVTPGTNYHNVVFVGLDASGSAKFACLRSTGSGKAFRMDVDGSDKRYAFSMCGSRTDSVVHVFEAPIDMLSYLTLLKMMGKEWRATNCTCLAGVYRPRKNIAESKLPLALKQYLSVHAETDEVMLHLDNDEAGRQATAMIIALLPQSIRAKDAPPPAGKDCNDYLNQVLRSIPIQKVGKYRSQQRTNVR